MIWFYLKIIGSIILAVAIMTFFIYLATKMFSYLLMKFKFNPKN
jgi:cation transporter-like permease